MRWWAGGLLGLLGSWVVGGRRGQIEHTAPRNAEHKDRRKGVWEMEWKFNTAYHTYFPGSEAAS